MNTQQGQQPISISLPNGITRAKRDGPRCRTHRPGYRPPQSPTHSADVRCRSTHRRVLCPVTSLWTPKHGVTHAKASARSLSRSQNAMSGRTQVLGLSKSRKASHSRTGVLHPTSWYLVATCQMLPPHAES